MKLVDTNVLLRLLVGDVPAQAEQVEKWFVEAPKASLFVPDCVVSEYCYVLQFNNLYSYDRGEIASGLRTLQSLSSLRFSPYVSRAVAIYEADDKLDMVDCLLAAQAQLEGVEVISFDKRLNKTL